jgi:trigger factor
LNVQTEHLETDHRARMTVKIDDQRLEKAKKQAARKIAKQVNIPGFRRGKAPYRVLIQNGLGQHILEDALEELSQDIYREIIQDSELEPYGPGTFENFEYEEEVPTFTYTIPLQPEATLGDYRSVRLEFEEPEVTDEELDRAMKRLRQQEALVEESQHPVKVGDRVTVDLHSTFADDPPEDVAEAESDEDEADDEENEPPIKGATFIHEEETAFDLDPDDEPILPGFIENLIGAEVDEERDFQLTVPDDPDDDEDFYAGIEGRLIDVNVIIEKIETVTLPELNDDFAARITENEEDGPLTLLELRVRMREQLYERKLENAKDQYANDVLSEIVEMSEFAFPEVMVEEQIDAMLKDFDQRLRQQGMSLESFMSLTGRDEDDLKADYREPAINGIKRTLVMREVIETEGLSVTNDMVDERIDKMVAQFGEQAAQIRSMFDTPQMRTNIMNEALQDMVTERIIAIARGEEIPEPGADEPTADDTAEVESDSADPVEEPVAATETEDTEDDTEDDTEPDSTAPEDDSKPE